MSTRQIIRNVLAEKAYRARNRWRFRVREVKGRINNTILRRYGLRYSETGKGYVAGHAGWYQVHVGVAFQHNGVDALMSHTTSHVVYCEAGDEIVPRFQTGMAGQLSWTMEPLTRSEA
jgi:hypothetical protein